MNQNLFKNEPRHIQKFTNTYSIIYQKPFKNEPKPIQNLTKTYSKVNHNLLNT